MGAHVYACLYSWTMLHTFRQGCTVCVRAIVCQCQCLCGRKRDTSRHDAAVVINKIDSVDGPQVLYVLLQGTCAIFSRGECGEDGAERQKKRGMVRKREEVR